MAKKTREVIWEPSEKQEMLLTCPAEEVFFGGARGGGKSDGLLVDFLRGYEYGPAHRGIIFRRTYGELEELIRRAREIYGRLGRLTDDGEQVEAFQKYHITAKMWEFDTGATLKFRFLENAQDLLAYQGHSYCVGVGTPILMADGTKKAIERIRPGDMVSTLQGPSEVTDFIQPYRTECVEAAGQLHPISHPVLTAWGWQSYASLLDICSKEFGGIDPEYDKPRLENVPVIRAILTYGRHGRISSRSDSPYRSDTLFDERFQGCVRFASRSLCDPRHVDELVRLGLVDTASLSSSDDTACVRPDQRIDGGSQRGYLSDHYFHGGPPLDLRESGIVLSPSLIDAGAPYRGHCRTDVPGNTPEYTRDRLLRYAHPYTGQELVATEDSVFSTCDFTPCGERLVCDITVSGPNHYVNADTGLVSLNSWIAFDELTNWPTDECYTTMFGCLRSAEGVPKSMRAAGNPGSVGHVWVKARFIDPSPPGTIFYQKDEEGNELPGGVCFIPSRLEDNPALMDNDPLYEARLKQLPPHLYKAHRWGDWSVFAGQAFAEFVRVKDGQEWHVIKPAPIEPEWFRFAALDWGYDKPYAFAVFAVSHTGRVLMVKEVYGIATGSRGPIPNAGVNKGSQEVAKKLWEIAAVYGARTLVCDPAMWARTDERSTVEAFEDIGFHCVRANNDRVAGWVEMHNRLQQVDTSGRPMFSCFDTCTHFMRTIVLMVIDEKKPEDLDSRTEDHLVDMTRYALMSTYAHSRPYTRASRQDLLREAKRMKQRQINYDPLGRRKRA